MDNILEEHINELTQALKVLKGELVEIENNNKNLANQRNMMINRILRVEGAIQELNNLGKKYESTKEEDNNQ